MDKFYFRSSSLEIEAAEAPWDSAIYKFPVVQINKLNIYNIFDAEKEFSFFQKWIQSNDVKMVSCRLPSEKIQEHFFLEKNNFRFIETVLHPQCSKLDSFVDQADSNINIENVNSEDLFELGEIARNAFVNERFYIEPRLDKLLSGERYKQWVYNSLSHPTQSLIKITESGKIIAFFLFERLKKNEVYWHLTAVNPKYQGMGYGKKAWIAMLAKHCADDVSRVFTTISSRNTSVLNLYSALGFRFMPPETSFHWINN